MRYLLVFLFALFFTSSRGESKPDTAGAAVVVNSDTLFKFYKPQGMFSPAERATVVSTRLQVLSSRLDFNADSLLIRSDTAVSAVYYKHALVFAINRQDAQAAQVSASQLAANYVDIIKRTLGTSNIELKKLLILIGEAVIVLIILGFLIWLVGRAFRWIRYRIVSRWDKRVEKLATRGAPANYTKRMLPFILSALRVLRFVTIILLIYLTLPIIFGIFPWTKPIGTELLGYVIDPLKAIALGLVHYIPNLLTIVVIYVVTRAVIKLVGFFANEVANGSLVIRNFYADWAQPTYNIIRVLLYAFMFVVIFPYLPGSQSKVFQGVTVFLGVLFSLGSSSAIANSVAGIVLTYMRPYKIGDRIKTGEVTGDVIAKTLLVTRIRTIKNEDITIPNATILNSHTVNYTSSSNTIGLILNTSITIGYDAPWQTVHGLLISAAEATEGILADPKPFVLQTALNDFNVTYQINAYTASSHQMAVIYSRLHQNIQDKFNEAGVEIMSPHYTAMRDGNAIQIPDDYKPKGYERPGFKVDNS